MSVDERTPLASYESKWAARHPEFGIALTFVPPSRRDLQSAFACWSFEIEHAAFATRDPEPAAIKLQWWAEELQCATRGEARHPLLRVLAADAAFRTISVADCYALINGALAQRDAAPENDGVAVFERHASLYRPLSMIAARLFPAIDVKADSLALASIRALRETASLAESLRAGRLPLPLDVLARHRLARGDVAMSSPAQAAVLREWLQWLAARMREARSRAPLGIVTATMLATARAHAGKSSRAGDPLAALQSAAPVPLTATLAAWRAARRQAHDDEAAGRHAPPCS